MGDVESIGLGRCLQHYGGRGSAGIPAGDRAGRAQGRGGSWTRRLSSRRAPGRPARGAWPTRFELASGSWRCSITQASESTCPASSRPVRRASQASGRSAWRLMASCRTSRPRSPSPAWTQGETECDVRPQVGGVLSGHGLEPLHDRGGCRRLGVLAHQLQQILNLVTPVDLNPVELHGEASGVVGPALEVVCFEQAPALPRVWSAPAARLRATIPRRRRADSGGTRPCRD